MKTILFAILSSTPSLLAAELVAGWDFNDLGNDPTDTSLTPTNYGNSTGNTIEHTNNSRWNTDYRRAPVYSWGSGYLENADNGYALNILGTGIRITNTDGIVNSKGETIGTDTGFTLYFNAAKWADNATSTNWSDSVCFTVADKEFRIEWNSGTGMNIYSGSHGTGLAPLNGVLKAQWHGISLTAIDVEGSENALYTLRAYGHDYTDGTTSLTTEVTFTDRSGLLTKYQTGGNGYVASNSKDTHVDNVALFDAALTDDQILHLANTSFTESSPFENLVVPEPSSASLSLLALSGLLLRRRRK